MSNEHACLRWRGGRWAIRDLGSKNRSWVNGKLLPPGVDVDLDVGDALEFGHRDASWCLEDQGPPQPMVFVPSGGEPCLIADGVIAIPSADAAAASIFRGVDGAWILEFGDRVRPITSGDLIQVMGTVWRFSCPSEWAPTAEIEQFQLIQGSIFLFDVSSDEEYVALTVERDGTRIAMGRFSAYYLLLTLARRRNEEQKVHPAAEAGWIHRDELVNMLRCSESQLNVWVHRIRSYFSQSSFLDHASVVERRDRTGQMRIGVERNVITIAGVPSARGD